jgi:hypothetical protein
MLFGKLLWEKETDAKNMCLKKEQLTNSQTPLIPDFLKQLLIYVRALEFDECPDYDEIINVIDTVYKEMGFSSVAESAAKSVADEDASLESEISDLE